MMRMDLIPEHELIHFVKIGTFGIPYSRTVPINKLEKIPLEHENIYYFRWFKSITWVPMEDKNLIYRDNETGESFTFSKRGIWNKEGISHELLSKL